MQHEIMKDWVRALRSGDYEQGTHKLHSAGKFCGLGVLCDIMQPAGSWVPDDLWDGELFAFGGRIAYEDDSVCPIPETLRDYLGLTDNDLADVVQINDSGLPFEYLASWIEQVLLKAEEPALELTAQ